MDKATKITIGVLFFVGLTATIGGLFWYNKNKKSNGGNEDDIDNFQLLINNIGLKPNKDNVVIANFNSNNNMAQFYINGRVIVFDKSKNIVTRGKYTDGGKNIILDNGKNISSGSVWDNLLQTLK